MDSTILVAVIGLAGIVVTALGSRAVTRRQARSEDRKASGDIQTSDAAALWQESKAMRQELRDEVANLRASHEDCESRVERLREEVQHMRKKLREV